MKIKHWLFIAFFLIGVLYVWHVYMAKTGQDGFKTGLGLR